MDNRLDPINTVLVNPPGAWSAPYAFEASTTVAGELWEKQDVSPACKIATTAGDKQVSWCNPGTPNCPMGRELEPTFRVDADIVYCDRDGDVFGNNFKIVNKGPDTTVIEQSCIKRAKVNVDSDWILIVLILLLIVITVNAMR